MKQKFIFAPEQNYVVARYYVTRRKLNKENYNKDAETKVASVANNRRKQTT